MASPATARLALGPSGVQVQVGIARQLKTPASACTVRTLPLLPEPCRISSVDGTRGIVAVAAVAQVAGDPVGLTIMPAGAPDAVVGGGVAGTTTGRGQALEASGEFRATGTKAVVVTAVFPDAAAAAEGGVIEIMVRKGPCGTVVRVTTVEGVVPPRAAGETGSGAVVGIEGVTVIAETAVEMVPAGAGTLAMTGKGAEIGPVDEVVIAATAGGEVVVVVTAAGEVAIAATVAALAVPAEGIGGRGVIAVVVEMTGVVTAVGEEGGTSDSPITTITTTAAATPPRTNILRAAEVAATAGGARHPVHVIALMTARAANGALIIFTIMAVATMLGRITSAATQVGKEMEAVAVVVAAIATATVRGGRKSALGGMVTAVLKGIGTGIGHEEVQTSVADRR